jgi:hypothetical protein
MHLDVVEIRRRGVPGATPDQQGPKGPSTTRPRVNQPFLADLVGKEVLIAGAGSVGGLTGIP